MPEPAAFAVVSGFDPEPLTTHIFPRHYLLYALDGLMALEADGRCWTLPPARAAWIAAHQPVNVRIARRIACCSLMFAPGAYPAPANPLRVFDMTPLLREVMLELRAFGPDCADPPPYARQLFDTAAMLAEQLAATPSQAWMPSVRSDVLRRALALTKDLLTVLHETSSYTFWMTYLMGALWGLGGLTFGLTLGNFRFTSRIIIIKGVT